MDGCRISEPIVTTARAASELGESGAGEGFTTDRAGRGEDELFRRKLEGMSLWILSKLQKNFSSSLVAPPLFENASPQFRGNTLVEIGCQTLYW
jgi:hypothetical protein